MLMQRSDQHCGGLRDWAAAGFKDTLLRRGLPLTSTLAAARYSPTSGSPSVPP